MRKFFSRFLHTIFTYTYIYIYLRHTLLLRKTRYIGSLKIDILNNFFLVSNLPIQRLCYNELEPRISDRSIKIVQLDVIKGQRTGFDWTVTMDTRLTQFQDEFRSARLWKSSVVARIPGTELHRIWGGGNARVIAPPPHPWPPNPISFSVGTGCPRKMPLA